MKPVIRTGHVRKAATAKCISATARGSWYMTVIAGLHKVPGNHIVRSVYVKEDRIYVGAFEEFGYFKYSEAGTLRYHSLSKFLKNFPMENNEIWNIVELDGRIYFQSFSAWFSYDGKMVHFPQQTATAALLLHPKRTYLHTDD
jgi:hypothetical protein